jgi:hypothetical protein
VKKVLVFPPRKEENTSKENKLWHLQLYIISKNPIRCNIFLLNLIWDWGEDSIVFKTHKDLLEALAGHEVPPAMDCEMMALVKSQ